MLATIGGPVDAPIIIGTVSVPKSADVHRICILLIDDDAADLARVTQTDVLPAFPTISRSIHPIAGGEVRSNVGFPRAHVNNSWIGGSDSNRADRSNGLMIEDGRPGHSGVRGFPDAAIDRAEIKRIRIPGDPGSSNGAASSKRTDEAPLEPAEKISGNGLRAQRRKSEAKKTQKK